MESKTADFKVYDETLFFKVTPSIPLQFINNNGEVINIKEGDNKLIRVSIKDGIINFSEVI